MARIQTFPDDVEILGGISKVQMQLGNAVPSALAELLGKEIRKQFFSENIDTEDISLIPPLRSDFPKEIPIAEVSEEYTETLDTEKPIDRRAS
jgi:DNA (cytosine-5)-methyltransferase 1